MTLIEHLEELRVRLIRVIVALSVVSVAAYFFSQSVVELLMRPLRGYVTELFFFEPVTAFMVRLKITLFTGIIFTSPYLFYETWMFVAPGLHPSERRVVLPITAISSLLFLIGVWFCYALVLPATLGFFLGFQTGQLKPLIDVERYFSFTTMFLASFGAAFDLPVFIVGLVKLGVLNSGMLRRIRKQMVVGIFILAAVITPSPDAASQIFLAVPMLFLYEASIWAARLVERKAKHGKKSSRE